MIKYILINIILLNMVSSAALVGGPYNIEPLDINGCGTVSIAGPYTLVASTGQSSGTGSIIGGVYLLNDGFWPMVSAVLYDFDYDGVIDIYDNCPYGHNPGQEDADNDGIGDVCDICTDTDWDGYGNLDYPANTCPVDNCPNDPNPGQEDNDTDGIGNVCDDCTDADEDGYGNGNNGNTGCPSGTENDCNDNCETCHPGATEVDDGLDNDCDDLIDEPCDPPIIVSAESVMEHKAGITCGISLSQDSATAGIEMRHDPYRDNPGPSKIVVTFGCNVQAYDGSLDMGDEVILSSGSGTVNDPSFVGQVLSIDIQDATKNACLKVTLRGLICVPDGSCVVKDPESILPPTDLYLKVCLGEVNGTTPVNTLDMSYIKQRLYKPVTCDNFRADVVADGIINTFDMSQVKSNLYKKASCP